MMNYDVIIEYQRPSGGTAVADVAIVDAKDDREAIKVAKQHLMQDFRRTIAKWGRAVANPTGPVAQPVQNGDVIEVKIKGRVRLRGDGTVELSDERGNRIRVSRERVMRDTGRPVGPKVTVEYVSLYPNGEICVKSYGPVKTSQYGVDQLIQIKVTKHDGKIVAKEFV